MEPERVDNSKGISDPRLALRHLNQYFAIIPEDLLFSGDASAVVVYGALDRVCKDGVGYISTRRLRELTGLSNSTIKRAKSLLIQEGYIIETFKGTGHRASEYQIPFQRRKLLVEQRSDSDHPGGSNGAGLPESSAQGANFDPPRGIDLESPGGTNLETKESDQINQRTLDGVSVATTPETPSKKGGKGKKRETQVTEEFRQKMRERWGNVLTDIDDRVNEALAHQLADKYKDLQAYVNGWLRRDWERSQQNPPPPRRGTTARATINADPMSYSFEG